jgi:hypothetical protein
MTQKGVARRMNAIVSTLDSKLFPAQSQIRAGVPSNAPREASQAPDRQWRIRTLEPRSGGSYVAPWVMTAEHVQTFWN